ncbi:hypothetical protein KSF78_0004251 [Schistosoma japonicum]|nr:hypothetical protein KSF78_0004251 [Schistosoma japonicum]
MLMYSEDKSNQEHLNKWFSLCFSLSYLFYIWYSSPLIICKFRFKLNLKEGEGPILNLWIEQHIWSMYLLCYVFEQAEYCKCLIYIYIVFVNFSLMNGYNAVILLKMSTIERLFPINVIILSIFTIIHSSIVATITYQNGAYDDVVSFFIVLLTSAILFMITMKYSYDITVIFYEYFYIFTLPLIFTPVLMVIFAITGYEIVFTKMFMVFTFIHFQFFTIITAQTLQGGHDVQIEIEDYVLGAMQMFIVILCSSLSLLTLFNNNSNEVYIWYKIVFLLFNIPLVYFAILVNEVNLKDKLMNNSK